MKTKMFAAALTLSLVLGSGYVKSGMAMMGGGHGGEGGGMGGHMGGNGFGTEGTMGSGSGSMIGPGSMSHQGATMPGTMSGSSQKMIPYAGQGPNGEGHDQPSSNMSDMHETVDTQHHHGNQGMEMDLDHNQ